MEGVLECLRPLIGLEARQWDYCVFWKLGDDPSRFIELVGCCCGGAYDCANVKEEEGEKHLTTQLCRDGFLKHPIRTKACEALAQIPSSMSLYSGIHAEVVVSAQPRWISGHANALDLNPSQSHHDSIGTRVLIPVLSGLIELYATKDIPENKKILEWFMAPCNIPLKQEVMTPHGNYTDMDLNASANLNELHIDLLPETYYPQKFLPSLHLANFITRPQVFPSLSPSISCASLEPSSNGSYSSSKHTVQRSKKVKCGSNLFEQQAGLAPGSVAEKQNAKVIRKTGDGHYHSKNLVAERNRRNRIKDREFALRALVPKITKMDRASIVGDAIEYIQELQKKVEELKDEIREIEEDKDFSKNKPAVKVLASDIQKEGSICLISADHKQGSPSLVQKTRTEVQVEVNQIGKRDCLIKLFCEHNIGGFARLMVTMDSLGLQVVDANVTTFDGNALYILKVEANTDIQAKKLRDKLIKLTGNQIVHKEISC